VTQRYLEYLKLMRDINLDVASEYLLMAATLAHIKSRELLPPSDEEQAEEEEAERDPRAELIARLLEYQKYKAVGEELGDRSVLGRDVFLRGSPPPPPEGPTPLAEVGLFKLLDAFEHVLHRVRGRVALEITSEGMSVQERMTQLIDSLRERERCSFEELFDGDRTRSQVVVTLLALLEMAKLHIVRVYQADASEPIHLQLVLLDAGAPTVPPAAEVTH
jgi:segregation and condensation protein A